MRHQSTPPRQQFVALCACGCERPTLIGFRGTPNRFLHGHGGRRNTPKESVIKGGYRFLYAPTHPLANSRGYVPEHRLVVERAIGRYLRPDEFVHHRDGTKLNNQRANLQIVSNAEHMAIHQAERKPSGWSRTHDRCRVCHTTVRPHAAVGLCEPCYRHRRHLRDRARRRSVDARSV